MPGYSGTPLPKKLGIREGAGVLLLGAPKGFEEELTPLPPGVDLRRRAAARTRYDVVLWFAGGAASLTRDFASCAARIRPDGGLWVAWPKKSSGVATDLSDALVRATGLAAGLVDNKVCAVNEVWSGLRFVVRLAERPRRKA